MEKYCFCSEWRKTHGGLIVINTVFDEKEAVERLENVRKNKNESAEQATCAHAPSSHDRM